MDCHLREVLQEERQYTHNLAENDWLIGYLYVIIYTETIKNCSKEHVFSDKANLSVSFKVWKRVIKIFSDPS